jgi:acyl dehydratase
MMRLHLFDVALKISRVNMQNEINDDGLLYFNAMIGRATGLPDYLQAGYRFESRHRFDPAAVSAFAHAVGDDNPLHHDLGAAQKTRFGRLIVSGTHTTALLMGLVASHYANRAQTVGIEFAVQLQRPVFADEEVSLQWTVSNVRPHQRSGHYVELDGTVSGADGVCRVRSRGKILVR